MPMVEISQAQANLIGSALILASAFCRREVEDVAFGAAIYRGISHSMSVEEHANLERILLALVVDTPIIGDENHAVC